MMEQVNWSPGVTLAQIEKQVILKAYKFYRGNAYQTAISLGVNEKTIRLKLERYEKDEQQRKDQEARDATEREEHLKRARGIVGQSIAQTGQHVHDVEAGARVEPAATATEKPAVPLSKR